MSTKGIYTALSGAQAQSQRLDTIANNIANVNTPAYKKDKQVFREYLTAHEKAPEVIMVPRIPASIESFYDMQGGDRGFVDSHGSYTDFSQGGIKATGQSLDIAIEGDGFFEVLTPTGVKFSRNGSFTMDHLGRLITKGGFPVLSEGTENSDPLSRVIKIGGRNLTVTEEGDIFRSGARVAKLGVVRVGNKDALHKVGQSLYSLRENQPPEIDRSGGIKVHQGFLETSNVNIVKEMTDMIDASRTFEATQKVIKAFDQLNDKLVNEVPDTR